VLGSKDPMNGLHCPGLRIDDTDKVLAAGRAHGTTMDDPNQAFFACSTCSGPDDNPIAGYKATIIGTVSELGDGMGRVTGAPGADSVAGTPLLTNIQVLDSMVACDPTIMVTVEADAGGNECLIRSAGDNDVVAPPPMMDDIPTVTDATAAVVATTTTTVAAPPPADVSDLMVGDEICITGFIMDTFCINRGTLLDAPSIVTLQNPDLHSYHCLLDVPVCVESGYQVLGEKDPSTGEYCLGYRLEETDTVVASGRAAGSVEDGCTTCTGNGMGTKGYRATVKGVIKDLGDGSQSVSGQPLLTNIQMLDASVECATPAPKTVCLEPPPAEITTTPAAINPPIEGEDCSSDFCETTLTEGYTLKYKINEADATVTMEATYKGEAWLGIAFSEDERMGGSNGIL